MERVAFILPDGTRVSSLLNPEHLVLRRAAGLAPRRTGAGLVSGAGLSDTPLLHTGGGRTELELRLLFDVDLVPAVVGAKPPETDPATPPRRDVRDHTRPLWDLAENTGADGRSVPTVRFVLGKEFTMLGVVESLAERLERFSPSGTPGRSWMTMRFVRVPDPHPPAPDSPPPVVVPDAATAAIAATMPAAVHAVLGGGTTPEGEPTGGETLPELAARYFGGRSALWRWIAEVNQLTDVVWPTPGQQLIIPPAPEQMGAVTTR